MVALGKPSQKEVKIDQSQKMKKSSILAFYEARTRWLRAIANSLRNEGHITIRESEEENQGSVTRGDVKVVKEIIMEESVVKDS